MIFSNVVLVLPGEDCFTTSGFLLDSVVGITFCDFCIVGRIVKLFVVTGFLGLMAFEAWGVSSTGKTIGLEADLSAFIKLFGNGLPVTTTSL